MDEIIRQIRNGAKAPGVDAVYSPGGLEFETWRAYRSEGIPLNRETLSGIMASARELGVDPAPLGV